MATRVYLTYLSTILLQQALHKLEKISPPFQPLTKKRSRARRFNSKSKNSTPESSKASDPRFPTGHKSWKTPKKTSPSAWRTLSVPTINGTRSEGRGGAVTSRWSWTMGRKDREMSRYRFSCCKTRKTNRSGTLLRNLLKWMWTRVLSLEMDLWTRKELHFKIDQRVSGCSLMLSFY